MLYVDLICDVEKFDQIKSIEFEVASTLFPGPMS